jgi:hypothetical protein
MRAKKLLIRTAVVVVTSLLTACSGGGVDVSVQGVTNPNFPPLPPAQGSEAIVSHGEITGLGNITVNDVHYQIGSATVTVNGEPASNSDLRLGQVVTLGGRINDDGRTGTADRIQFNANVVGPVEGIDAVGKQLIVMGQTVTTDADAYFGGEIDPATYAGLEVGDVVQVSGFNDASGAIRATRIDPAPADATLQVTGTVADLDIANLLFRINRLTIDYSNALVIDLPDGAPANAMRVKAFGAVTAGHLVVERLIVAPEFVGSTGQRAQAAGVVTRFSSAADFDVDYLNVRADAETVYQNGPASNLGLDAEVVIDGSFASNGQIAADQITFGHDVINTARLTYGYRDFSEISVPTVFTLTVSQGPEFSVEVFVDSGYEDRIDVTQAGSRLTIALLPGDGNIHTLDAVVTMPVLEQIDLSGVVTASLYDFDQPRMTINVGGVSFLRGNALQIGDLTSSVTGVSRMDLVNVSPIANADITVSGVSQVTLNMDVGAAITGSVSTGPETGVSTLFYYGTNVNVNVTTDPLSSIVRLGDTRP